MKYILSFFLVTLFTFTTSAQKQTYFLFAYGQKIINTVCGEKISIKEDEVSLMPAEVFTYRNKMLTEIRATYSKGYGNFYVELVPAGKAVIVYEFERVYTTKQDGWDCTTTFYGCVTAADMLAAEKAYAALQAQYKKSTYKEVRRWGKPAILTPAAVGENDVTVNWTTAPKNYLLNMTNTRKDVALSITIVSYKLKAGIAVQKGSENDISKMTKSGEITLLLEPGMTSQNMVSKADGFQILISPKAATKEEQGLINKIRQIIKGYVTCPDYKCEPKPSVGMTVRG